MATRRVRFDRRTGARFTRAIRNFAASEAGPQAKILFTALIGLLLALSGLNVVNSYVGRDFMTAIEQRDMGGFTREAILYLCVFAASTVAAVVYRFTEERLGLLWREWLTRRLITLYLDQRNYYWLSRADGGDGAIANPDQRIADDVRAFTVTTISFVLLLLNGTLTVIAFSGVLWSISPLLFGVTVLYAAVGSLLTIAVGRPLVWLNYNQSDQEANLRSALIHVRANAESVVLSGHEPHLVARLLRHVDAVVANFRRIVSVNRNVGFSTTGYNYLIQIIPALLVAPLFIRGEVPFGVITQSAIAFTQLIGAFSLIVTQFQSISSFAAVVARIGSLAEGIERAHAMSVLSTERCPHGQPMLACPICLEQAAAVPVVPKIAVREEEGRIAYEGLTLLLPPDGRIGVRALSISIPLGTRTVVLGDDEAAKTALLLATVGVWGGGEGSVIRPRSDRVMFLSERPYLPPGTLREVLTPPAGAARDGDEAMLTVLRALRIEEAVSRAGGLDAEADWDRTLSLSEQQRLAAARVILAAPQFVLLHRIGTTLSADEVDDVLRLLSAHAITYVALEQTERPDRYDAVLRLAADGTWTWTTP